MKSIFLILFNTKKAFRDIGEDYVDDLHRKNLILFSLYGLSTFVVDFTIEQSQDEFYWFFYNLFLLAFSIAITIAVMILLSCAIYWIGKQIAGKSEYINIETTIAHALLPIMIGLIMVSILKRSPDLEAEWNNAYFRNSIHWLSGIIFFKIIFQGVKNFNHFSIWKTLLAISLLILINIVGLILYYIYM